MRNKNLFDEVKGIFQDLNSKIGQSVSNLHGTVEATSFAGSKKQTQQWFVLTAGASTMPSLNEFVNSHSYERPGHNEVNAVEGVALFRPSNDDVQRAVMFFTAARLSGPREFPVEIDAPGYEIAVYVNKVRVGSGKETLVVNPRIYSGVHYISVVLYGGQGAVQVTTDETIACFRSEPLPSPPSWAGDSVGNYLDAVRGLIASRLAWHNDSFAAAWNVYRAPGIALPHPTDIVFDPEGFPAGYVMIMWDDFELQFTIDEYIYTNDFYVGTIESIDAGEGYTYLVFEPSLETPTLAEEETEEALIKAWIGEKVNWYREGTYSSVTTVTYSGDSIITFDDTDVKLGHVYTYKLTALGFITMTTESDYSDIDWVLAADREPPGPLEILEVKEEGSILKVIYKSPDDPDFAGVRVYGPYTTEDPVGTGEEGAPVEDDEFDADKRVSIKYGEANRIDQIFIEVDTTLLTGDVEQIDFYLSAFDASGNERPPIDASLVSYIGNVGNAIAVTDHFWTIFGEVEGIPYRIFQMQLSPAEKTKSAHVRWRRYLIGIPTDWIDYDFDIDEPEIHTLQDEGGLTDATFAGAGFAVALINAKDIMITPYNLPGGAAGGGNPGTMITFTTEVTDKAEIGIQKHDDEVDLVRQDAHKMIIWDGFDFPTKAQPGDLFILRPEE